MKLRFLGQTYNTYNHQIDTEILTETGRFLGQNYSIRRPVKTVKSQLGLRKYRGVAYDA